MVASVLVPSEGVLTELVLELVKVVEYWFKLLSWLAVPVSSAEAAPMVKISAINRSNKVIIFFPLILKNLHFNSIHIEFGINLINWYNLII